MRIDDFIYLFIFFHFNLHIYLFTFLIYIYFKFSSDFFIGKGSMEKRFKCIMHI